MNRSGFQVRESGKSIDKLCLTVSVDSGDADDLARPYLEGNVLHGILFTAFTGNCHSLHIKHDIARFCRRFVDGKADISSDHHGGKLLRCGIFYIDGIDVFSFSQDRAAVSNFHDLV